MKCPFCDSEFVVYNSGQGTECCGNPKCCLSVKPDGKQFWEEFVAQVKEAGIKAVKQADEKRKCLTCTYYNVTEHICSLTAVDGVYHSFGCADWVLNESIPLVEGVSTMAWLVKLESMPEVVVFAPTQGKAADMALAAYIQVYGSCSGLPQVTYTHRRAQYDKSPLNKSITPHAYSVEAVNKSLGGSND